MKTIKLITLILTVFLLSCERQVKNFEFDSPYTGPGVLLSDPTLLSNGGNVSCEDIFANPENVLKSVKGDFSGGTFSFETEGWPDGLQVTVSPDGRYVSFTSSGFCNCVGAVIVKGGNGANIYTYENGITTDELLHAPVNSSGKPAGLSNLTFCFVQCTKKLVIAIKTYATEPIDGNFWAVSNGIGSNMDALHIGYVNFVCGTDNIFPIYKYGNTQAPIGTISATYITGTNNRPYLRIILNSNNDQLNFTNTHLYVGTSEFFNTNFVKIITPDVSIKTNYLTFPFFDSDVSNPKEILVDLSLVH